MCCYLYLLYQPFFLLSTWATSTAPSSPPSFLAWHLPTSSKNSNQVLSIPAIMGDYCLSLSEGSCSPALKKYAYIFVSPSPLNTITVEWEWTVSRGNSKSLKVLLDPTLSWELLRTTAELGEQERRNSHDHFDTGLENVEVASVPRPDKIEKVDPCIPVSLLLETLSQWFPNSSVVWESE